MEADGDAHAAPAAAAATAPTTASLPPPAATAEEVAERTGRALAAKLREAEDICSDYNLNAFLIWARRQHPMLVRPVVERCVVEVHTPPPLLRNIPTINVKTPVVLRDGTELPLIEVPCIRDGCERCGHCRGGYRFRWDGLWTCLRARRRPPLVCRQIWQDCQCDVCARLR
jgi:hypothetical protein